MEVGECSRELTTFYTHEDLFRFKRLVQGSGPASQELHEKFWLSLHGLHEVIQIQNNVLVFGKTDEEHLQNLKGLFKRLVNIGATLTKQEC